MKTNKTNSRRRNQASFHPQCDRLEDRRLLAGITFNAWTGRVVVEAAQQISSAATISRVGSQVQVTLNIAEQAPQTKYFAADRVWGVDFNGGLDRDAFVNRTNIPSTVHGGGGNDILVGGSANDVMFGDLGNDLIDGGLGDDTLYGGDGNDLLLGNLGNDWLYGGSGNDFLHGGVGNDSLRGEAGNDALCGGGGFDSLFDLQGSNNFVDTGMTAGRSLGIYRGNSWDSYQDSQRTADNLTVLDILARARAQTAIWYTGYGDTIDRIASDGGYRSLADMFRATQSSDLGMTPATAMLKDAMNALYPSS